jgi:hypothetical protein
VIKVIGEKSCGNFLPEIRLYIPPAAGLLSNLLCNTVFPIENGGKMCTRRKDRRTQSTIHSDGHQFI